MSVKIKNTTQLQKLQLLEMLALAVSGSNFPKEVKASKLINALKKLELW